MSSAKEKVRNKVRKGADALDTVKPRWFDDINPDTLKMESCEECILGQLFSTYGAGMAHIDNIDVFTPHELGFDICRETRCLRADSYEILADFWIEEIEKRKDS